MSLNKITQFLRNLWEKLRMSFFVGKRPSNGKPLLHINSVTPVNGSIQEAPDENTIFHSDLPFIFVEEYTSSNYVDHVNVHGVGGMHFREFVIPSQVVAALADNQVVLIRGIDAQGTTQSYVQTQQMINSVYATLLSGPESNLGSYSSETRSDNLIGGDVHIKMLSPGEPVGYASAHITRVSSGGKYSLQTVINTVSAETHVYEKYQRRGGTTHGFGDQGVVSTGGVSYVSAQANRAMVPFGRVLRYYGDSGGSTSGWWEEEGGYYNTYTNNPHSFNAHSDRHTPSSHSGSTVYRPATRSTLLNHGPPTKLSFLVLNVKGTSNGFQYIPTGSGDVYMSKESFRVGDVELNNSRIIYQVESASLQHWQAWGITKTPGTSPIVGSIGSSSAEAIRTTLTESRALLGRTQHENAPVPVINSGGGVSVSTTVENSYWYGADSARASILEIQDTSNIVGSWKIESDKLTIQKGTSELFSSNRKPLKFLGQTYSFTFNNATAAIPYTIANSTTVLASWGVGSLATDATFLVRVEPTNIWAVRTYSNTGVAAGSVSSSWGSRFVPVSRSPSGFSNNLVATLKNNEVVFLMNFSLYATINTNSRSASTITTERKNASYLQSVFLRRSGNSIQLCFKSGYADSSGASNVRIGIEGLRINFMRLT